MIIKSYTDSIGKQINEIMRKKGLSRYRVSKDLGIAQESLLGLLKGGANPRWETIKKALNSLGYEIRLVEQKRRRS